MLNLRSLVSAALVAAVSLSTVPTLSLALNNGLALTPQMGWNSWNHFACSIDESLIRSTAQAIINSGLAAAGYTYVNLDDCWQVDRASDGSILADPAAFPSGIAALANDIHALGLRFGLYSDCGMETCQGRPGGLNYEKIDARTYASWGVDYLKYDNCNSDTIDPKLRYPRMRDALNMSGRPILFSMCEWGVEDPATWAPAVGNSWRTTGDIQDSWQSMLSNLDQNDRWWRAAGPGQWNDPDMLEVGNGGMSYDEYVAHFSLWSLIKSPLLIGCDVTNISSETLGILTNADVIALNQDPLGVQGHRVANDSAGHEVWAGPLANGDVAVVLFNRAEAAANITAHWADIGVKSGVSATVRDLWSKQTLGAFTDSIELSVNAHASRTLRIAVKQTQSDAEDIATVLKRLRAQN